MLNNVSSPIKIDSNTKTSNYKSMKSDLKKYVTPLKIKDNQKIESIRYS